MIKLLLKFTVTSLTVLVFVFGMNANVSALTMISYDGNVFGMKLDEVNSIIDNYNNSLNANSSLFPTISDDSWPVNEIEMEGTIDLKKFTFDNLNTPILITKAGNMTYMYDVRGVSTLNWISPNDKGLSSYSSVPDASIMLLLGSSLIGLAVFSRKSKNS